MNSTCPLKKVITFRGYNLYQSYYTRHVKYSTFKLLKNTAPSEIYLAVPQKIKHTLLYDPTMPPLCIPKRNEIVCAFKTFTWMFISALFIISKRWNQPKVHQLLNI